MDFIDVADDVQIGPVAPGDVLREDFLLPLRLAGRALARDLGVPSSCIIGMVAAERAISADTAILLVERFGTTTEFWPNLPMMHDLERAPRSRRSPTA